MVLLLLAAHQQFADALEFADEAVLGGAVARRHLRKRVAHLLEQAKLFLDDADAPPRALASEEEGV